MSGKQKDRAGNTANKAAPGGAALDKGAAIDANADMARGAIAAAEAQGVEWTLCNTEPCLKSFVAELRLDICGRVKLGLLAAKAGRTPEEWLSLFLLNRFTRLAEATLAGIGGKQDESLACQYKALYRLALSQTVYVGDEIRLAFRPSVMA